MSWQKIDSWQFVIPPSRPSKAQLAFIERHIYDIDRSKNVGVLGSTVEYRDILKSLGFENVFVFENNIDYYKYSSKFLRNFNPNENLIESDWRNLSQVKFNKKFSLILSHLTMGNIPYCDRDVLYSEVSNLLSKNGVFIDFVLCNSIKNISTSDIQKEFDQSPVNILEANKFSCRAIFCSELSLHEERVDTSILYDYYQEYLGPKFENLLSLSELVTPRGGLWYYGRDWSKVSSDYFKYFCPFDQEEESFDSPYHNRATHFAMSRKMI